MATLFERFKKSANDAISDYSQLKDAYPNVKNFGSALKKSISAHIPSNEDFQSPERMSEWAQSAALNAPMLGTFTGSKSLKWDKEKAAMAEKLLDDGVNPAQVWKDHLIGRLPGGQLFSEIPDHVAHITPNATNTGKLSELLHHRPLYSNYDDIGNIQTNIKTGLPDEGLFSPNKPEISINSLTLDSAKPNLLHEIQHAIQVKEGWPVGGSPINDTQLAKDIYSRLTGEAMARSTQGREGLNMQQRRDLYPLADNMLDDQPLNRLIDYYGHGQQKSLPNLPETEFSRANKTRKYFSKPDGQKK